ncbi:MAG: hypothetical protein WCR61_00275 [Bacteroidales bacterium]|nr:hypothetical protein [Bacteroidales bacterium]MDD4656587.1 hypothetical protein [Bacteroidales bacterium]
MEASIDGLNLITLSYEEAVMVWGGSQGWDHDIAEGMGKAAGYAVKKLWRAFLIISKGLYEGQANSQVVYK